MARRRLFERGEISAEDELSLRPRTAGGLKKVTLCPEQFLYFLQQMFNGVTLGSTYALIAIGYTMVYGIIGMINFAHGEVYMIGSYVSFMIIAALMMMGIDTSWLLVAAGFVGAIVIASAYGWSIERVAYRPVRNPSA